MSARNASIFILLGFIIILLFGWLGIQPLYLEEQRRAVVAMEMLFSGDYITPTIFGEAYFKKPPVWNWILVGAFRLFGDYSEFSLRFFAVVSFLLSALLIWLFTKRHMDSRRAVASSLLYLTSADIFLYFSLTAEIDLFYSLLILAIIFSTIHFYSTGKKRALFLLVYALSAIAFLTKGMPTLLFTGITLLVVFLYHRDFRGLISWSHTFGILLFIILLGSYFYIYSTEADITRLIAVLWDESSQRIVGEMPVRSFFSHLLLFPLEILKNLLPASLLILLFLRKPPLVRGSRLSGLIFLILITNILVYWLSPGTRQRYIYMLYPLIIILLVDLYYRLLDISGQTPEWFRKTLNALAALIVLAMLAVPFLPQLAFLPNHLLASLLGLGLIGLSWYFLMKRQKQPLLFMVAIMVTLRLFSNLTVITFRGTPSNEVMPEVTAGTEIGKMSRGQEVFILGESDIPLRIAYYAYREREAAFGFDRTVVPRRLYLTDSLQLHRQESMITLDTFHLTSGKPFYTALRPKP